MPDHLVQKVCFWYNEWINQNNDEWMMMNIVIKLRLTCAKLSWWIGNVLAVPKLNHMARAYSTVIVLVFYLEGFPKLPLFMTHHCINKCLNWENMRWVTTAWLIRWHRQLWYNNYYSQGQILLGQSWSAFWFKKDLQSHIWFLWYFDRLLLLNTG